VAEGDVVAVAEAFLPALLVSGRRMISFDRKVVDGFVWAMERSATGPATQSNAYDEFKEILLDAYRMGIFDENPLEGVSLYNATRNVIPSVAQLRETSTAGSIPFH
jgi:hypothetical protein